MRDGTTSAKETARNRAAERDLGRLGVTTVPDGWKLSTVGKACTIRNDLRLPLSVETRAVMQGEYPYYGPTGILDYIDEFRAEGEFALIGEDGDHFLDTEKKSQTVRVSGRFNVNNHAHLIASGKGCAVDWFFQFFRHRDISHSLTRQGAGRYKLTKQALEKLPILLPPLPEQRKIAEILRTWDEALEKYGALKEAKERQYRWLQQRLLDHKPARRKWVSVELGTIICQRSEHSSQHDEYPVLTSSRRGLFLQSQYFSKQVTSADNTGYKIMRHGDFTFRSMSDDGRFVFNRLQEHEVGIISPAYGVFFAEGVSPKFLVHFLNSAYFSQLLSRETQGGTRKALRFSALAQMEVDLPNGEDQERIAEILDEARREIDLLEAQITTVQAQKRGLMQKLSTGEWRVKLEAPVA